MARRTHFFVRTFYAPTPEYDVSWASETQWQPRVDVYQADDKILIHVEAPGLLEENLRLHFEDGALVVEGRRERPELPCPQHCLQVEISYGSFQRVLPLPRDIDSHNIHAEYSDGILQITVPRRSPQRQSIEINAS